MITGGLMPPVFICRLVVKRNEPKCSLYHLPHLFVKHFLFVNFHKDLPEFLCNFYFKFYLHFTVLSYIIRLSKERRYQKV